MAKIYHYSGKKFDILMTREKSQNISKEKINKEREKAKVYSKDFSYNEHVSFFIDQVPLDILGNLFGDDHPFWVNGNQIWEYTVDTGSLDSNIYYDLVESPTATKLLDSYDWTDESEQNLIKFLKLKKEAKIKAGEIGYGIHNLNKMIDLFKGSTRKYFIAASKRPNFEENRNKYAANVPHLMLYPKSGLIKIEHFRLVTVGNVVRTKHPAYFKW